MPICALKFSTKRKTEDYPDLDNSSVLIELLKLLARSNIPSSEDYQEAIAYLFGVLADFAISLNLSKLPPGRRRYLVTIGNKFSGANVCSAT